MNTNTRGIYIRFHVHIYICISSNTCGAVVKGGRGGKEGRGLRGNVLKNGFSKRFLGVRFINVFFFFR